MTDPRQDRQDDEVRASLGEALILPGGKVDPDAIHRAIEQAREKARASGGDGAEPELPRVAFTLQRELQTRLDKYLTSRIKFMSRTQLQRLIESGGVTVNGRAAKPSAKLMQGDRVEVVVPPPPDTTIRPEEIPLEVLFEDEHVIVLNKQADIIVHPARSENSGTMVNALAWHFQHVSGGGLSGVGEEFARPGVVHRLDRDTTGCIIFAKQDEAHWKMGHQFEYRKVDKRYLALVEGRVEPDMVVIDLPLGPHPSREKGYREKQVVRHDDLGKASLTVCRVRERYSGDRGVFSLVELELKTGRTHQIRVHMSYNRWPIIGDDMYGGGAFERASGAHITRQMLHAGLLAFSHPISGEPVACAAPPPEDMGEVIEVLRAGGMESVHVEGTVPLARFGL